MIEVGLYGALETLPANVAVLDDAGRIVWVNGRWRTFGQANGWTDPTMGLGADYLAVARSAHGRHSHHATEAADLVADVLGGRRFSGQLGYSCDGPREPRMFYLVVTRLIGTAGVAVLHIRTGDHRASRLAATAKRLMTGSLLVCAWCGSEFDDLLFTWRARRDPLADPGTISHGICETCVAHEIIGPAFQP